MKTYLEYFIIGVIVFSITTIYNYFYNSGISMNLLIENAIVSTIFVLLNVLFDIIFKKRKE